jgi:hypothetical protein
MDTDKLKSIEEYLLKLEETLSDLKCDNSYLQAQIPRVVTKIQILSTNAFIANDSEMKQKLSRLEASARKNLEKIENLLSQKL